MTNANEKADRFLALHRPGTPLLMPNAWDRGSAVLLASLGFHAIATTSSGHAATLGLLDGGVGRDDAIAHGASLAAATEVPVSADLEDGFGESPAEVAATVALAIGAGLAGCSIEDYGASSGIYDTGLAAERVAAAAAAAHGPARVILTARCDNLIRGRDDLDEVIERLQAYETAGADVLYAPGLMTIDDVRRVVESVGRPVNVLARPGAPSVAELAEAGVARISVGGAFAFTALGAVAAAARELLDDGTYGYWDTAQVGLAEVRRAFGR